MSTSRLISDILKRFDEIFFPLVNIDMDLIPGYCRCYLNPSNEYIIKSGTHFEFVVMTRSGGSNREEYENGNKYLITNENYIYDEDADYDNTYAYFYYKIPMKWNCDVINITNGILEDLSQDFCDLIIEYFE